MIELNKYLSKFKIYDKTHYDYLLKLALTTYKTDVIGKHIFIWDMIIEEKNGIRYIGTKKPLIKTITKIIDWKFYTLKK